MFSFFGKRKEIKWNLPQVALITFISFIIISVITFFIYFSQVFKRFHIEAIQYEHTSIQKDMEALKTSLPKLTIQILSNPDVSNVLSTSKPDSETLYSALNALKSHAFYNNISQITIYDSKTRSVWVDRYLQCVPLEEHIAQHPYFEQVLNDFSNNGDYIIITPESNPVSDTPLNNITYTCKDYRGYILFYEFSQSDYAKQLLKKNVSHDYDTWVYYQDNNLILTNRSDNYDIKSDTSFTKKLGKSSSNFTYGDMLYTFSSMEDLQFITAVSYRDVLLNGLSTSAFFWLLITAIASLIFASFKWFQNYSLKMLVRHRNDMDMTKKEMDSLVVKHLLVKLLNGKTVKKSDIEHLKCSFPNPYCRVIILHIDNTEQLLNDNSSDDIAIFKYGICNVACELLAPYGQCMSFDIDTDIATIILNSQNATEEEDIKAIVTKIKALTKEIYDLTVTATISKCFTSLEHLTDGIADSLELSTYRYIKGYDSLILESDRPFADLADRFPETMFSQLEAAMDNEDSQAVKMIMSVFQTTSQGCTAISVRNQLLQLFLHVLRNKKSSRLISRDFETLLSFKTLSEATKYFEEAILKNSESKAIEESDFIHLAETLTAQNYANSDYHIGYIADRLQISISYAGKRFKNMFGRSFNSYLMEYRIEKAASLLRNSNLKINEISTKCGFNSDTYFVTNFKKFKNMTPQGYRNSHS